MYTFILTRLTLHCHKPRGDLSEQGLDSKLESRPTNGISPNSPRPIVIFFDSRFDGMVARIYSIHVIITVIQNFKATVRQYENYSKKSNSQTTVSQYMRYYSKSVYNRLRLQ